MLHHPFRFIHASDLHLEMPPQGVAEVPSHLRELFIESTYWAAERVFDTVLSEQAHFLVLSGDILDPQQTGPRGPLFLLRQFVRLAQHNIPVYWAGGQVDPPDVWPASVALPNNVHMFPRGQVEQLVYQHDDVPWAQLIGTSGNRQETISAKDFVPDPSGLFSIAVAYGQADAAVLQPQGIHYWALGGRHERGTLMSSPQVAHYPGSPQGRHPRQCGPHGCTLVQVDDSGQARTSLVPTDAMRWKHERVTIDETTTQEDLENALRERMRMLVESIPSVDLLVSWTITGKGPLSVPLRRGPLANQLRDTLRGEFGYGPPAAWTLSLEAELADSLAPADYEQETICGDFLRAVRHLQVNTDDPLELQSYLSEEHLAGTLGATIASITPAFRQDVLRDVGWLGVDLLAPEEPTL